MELNNINAIHIKWDGPKSLKEAQGKEKSQEKEKLQEDYGVYQIYGFHPVYGPNVLLYIGKADEQIFDLRFKQHGNSWMEDSMEAGEYKIYFGRLVGESTPTNKDWSNEIEIAEELLIFAHSPAYNSKSIYSIDEEKVHNYIVFNWGNRGSLLYEVSGMRMTTTFWKKKDINIDTLVTFKYDK